MPNRAPPLSYSRRLIRRSPRVMAMAWLYIALAIPYGLVGLAYLAGFVMYLTGRLGPIQSGNPVLVSAELLALACGFGGAALFCGVQARRRIGRAPDSTDDEP